MKVSYIKNSVSDVLFIGHELTVRQIRITSVLQR